MADKTAEAFGKKYPGLTVKAVRATTGGIFQRMNQDLRANNAVASVFSMSGIGDHYGQLMRDKHLASYMPPSAANIHRHGSSRQSSKATSTPWPAA